MELKKGLLAAAEMKKKAYWRKLRALFGADIIGYWPRVYDGIDVGPNSLSSAKTNITQGIGIGDGFSAAYFAGNGRLNLQSTLLAQKFNGVSGTLITIGEIPTVEGWSDGTNECFANFATSDNSRSFRIQKSSTSNTIYFFGCGQSFGVAGQCFDTRFIHTAITWSEANNRFRSYYKATLRSEKTVSTSWGASALGKANIGSADNGLYPLTGAVAHTILLGREATPDEIYKSYALFRNPKRISFIGDSIETGQGGWNYQFGDRYGTGQNFVINHAVGSMGVIVGANNLAYQVSAAASDDADIIFIKLGTNDDNAGNMTTLQAAVENGIAALKISNPRASIYYLNVLPRTLSPTDKALIRAAINAGCTSQGITCFDTSADPWIDPSTDTSDGLHPNATGHGKIITRILALIP